MSNFPADPPNPYAGPQTMSDPFERPVQTNLPTFCKVMFIISLVFCAIRVILVMFGIAGFFAMQQQGADNPFLIVALFEIITGASMAFFGILGNSLLLARKPWAITLGWLTVASTLGSMGVGLWQVSIVLGQLPEGPEKVGGIIGGVIAIGVRLVILGLYVAALMQFSTWARKQHVQNDWGQPPLG